MVCTAAMDPCSEPCKIYPENVCHNDLPPGDPAESDAAQADASLGGDAVAIGAGGDDLGGALYKGGVAAAVAAPADEVGGTLPHLASDTVAAGDTDGGNAGIARPSRRAAAAPAYLMELRKLTDRLPLARLAAEYLAQEVHGVQSDNTLEAKTRDLTGFVRWFAEYNGHGDPGLWLPRDTQSYLRVLEGLRRAPTTVNRALATLGRFARWCHELPGQIFARGGLPTRGVKALMVSEPDCKKLSRRDCHALFKVADLLVSNATHARARPRRTRAVFALLYYTGLRVSELTALRRSQYCEGYLVNVARKGKARSRGVYVPMACRRWLEDYLEHEWPRDMAGVGFDASKPEAHGLALFLASGNPEQMARQHIHRALAQLAREASKHRDQPIHLHPHRLRHTFGAEYRDKTGSETETAAALGHAGLQHIGRYVRRSVEEREAIAEQLFETT